MSSGRSHVKNPLLKSHLEFSDLAMFSKTYVYNIILLHLVYFWSWILIFVISNTKVSRFRN